MPVQGIDGLEQASTNTASELRALSRHNPTHPGR